VPVWGEFCWDTWVIPTPVDCNNACAELAPFLSVSPSANQCLDGCKNVIRGAGCYPIRYPAEVGNYLASGFDPVTGFSYPNFNSGVNVDAATVNQLATFPARFFANIPTCTAGASATKDPHLHLAHGDRADFRGEDGAIFNMLSHANVSLNVKTVAADFHWSKRLVHGTKMAAAFWKVVVPSGRVVTVEYDADTPTHVAVNVTTRVNVNVNGNMVERKTVHADSPRLVIENVVVELKDKSAVVTTANKWELVAKQSPFPFGNLNKKQSLIDVTVNALYDADNDVLAPHGIIGQSYDGDNLAVDGKIDSRSGNETTTSAQAEGAIEGHYSDYKMGGPYETDFKFSRFAKHVGPHRDVSKLSGAKRHRGAKAPVEAISAKAPVEA